MCSYHNHASVKPQRRERGEGHRPGDGYSSLGQSVPFSELGSFCYKVALKRPKEWPE